MNSTLVLGTRGSKLAVAQSSWVAREIERETGIPVVLKIIQTKGDVILNKPLAEIGGKGLFTAELEQSLLDETIDFAVHSCKDLPTEDPEGLVIACFPRREDPRDALVGAPLEDGLMVGTGSARRQAQITLLKSLKFKGIRGNVDTRIAKMEQGEYDTVVLAMAGLNRIEIQRNDVHPISIEHCIPAPAQGALALQAKSDRHDIIQLLKSIECPSTKISVEAERSFLQQIGGGCHAALGAHVTAPLDGQFEMRIFYQEGDKIFRFVDTSSNPMSLAKNFANQIQSELGHR